MLREKLDFTSFLQQLTQKGEIIKKKPVSQKDVGKNMTEVQAK